MANAGVLMADFELARRSSWSWERVGVRITGAVRLAGIRGGPVAERSFLFTQRSVERADGAGPWT
jgi:hypothetical protein